WPPRRICWLQIPTHFPDTVLHEYIIMANHLRGTAEIIGANHYLPEENRASNLRAKDGSINRAKDGSTLLPYKNFGWQYGHGSIHKKNKSNTILKILLCTIIWITYFYCAKKPIIHRIPNLKITAYMSTNARYHHVSEKEIKNTHGTYGATLLDIRWKNKRKEILSRDGGKCVICRSTDKLQVHHRQYHFVQRLNRFKDPWEYDNNLMITLCQSCHSRGHYKYTVPTKYL